MSPTWRGAQEPSLQPLTQAQILRAVLRGVMIVLTLGLGIFLFGAARLAELCVCQQKRQYSPYVTQLVCKIILIILRLKVLIHGHPMAGPGAMVANHSSWLDILVLNAHSRVFFVAKSEVSAWAGIGFLARLTGTVFVQRDPRQAKAQTKIIQERVQNGHHLLFFPEGTSSDGLRVLSFKPVLFQAFFDVNSSKTMAIQPVAMRYCAPKGQAQSFYGWWGDMDLGPHLLHVLGQAKQGAVALHFLPTLKISDFDGRKSLAAAAHAKIDAYFTDQP